MQVNYGAINSSAPTQPLTRTRQNSESLPTEQNWGWSCVGCVLFTCALSAAATAAAGENAYWIVVAVTSTFMVTSALWGIGYCIYKYK